MAAEDRESIAEWFATWGGHVAACEFAPARALFAPEVASFGTYMDTVEGIDQLEERQWRSIWPTIRDFRFVPESLRVFVSPDRRQASAMILWHSTGIDADGNAYERPGRSTVVLERERVGAPWRGVHTHFSEFPRERKKSFGGAGRV